MGLSAPVPLRAPVPVCVRVCACACACACARVAAQPEVRGHPPLPLLPAARHRPEACRDVDAGGAEEPPDRGGCRQGEA